MANAQSILLHQYGNSPFSEKVRLALRLKNLAWGKVEIPTIMPKPDLMPLTGGYRRTPVMQIGGDIYCDTALILRMIEARFPERALGFGGHEGVQSMVASWTDKQWFQTTVGLVFGSLGEHISEEFKADRSAMSGRKFDTEKMKLSVPLLMDQWRAQLSWVEERLQASKSSGIGDWLLGSKPGLTDIHAHMNIWFLNKNLPQMTREFLRDAPRTEDWFDRLNAISGPEPEEVSSADALEIAKNSAPRLLAATVGTEPQGLAPGDHVSVAPDDYGQVWVTGELVSAQPNKITLFKVENAIESLHIHFPRAGDLVRKVES